MNSTSIMFGVEDIDVWLNNIIESPSYRVGGYDPTLMSLLSDVQELLSLDRHEEARQAINRIKYLVITHLEEHL